MILWNMPVAFLIFLSQKYHLINHEFSEILYPGSLLSWVNAVTGFLGSPANYPLNFLRDLFAVFFFVPLFRLLLNINSLFGLFVVLTIYHWNLDGIMVLRNSMIVSFYLGAMASYCKWDIKLLDDFSIYFLSILLIICTMIVFFNIKNIQWFRLISPLLIWPSTSLFHNNFLGNLLLRYSHNSFFTFLSHGPLLLILWLGFEELPDKTPYILFWFLAPAISVYMAIISNRFLQKKFPNFLSVFMGGR